MHKANPTCAAILVGCIILLGSYRADARSFGEYNCKRSCAPYARGYRWAERAHVTDPNRCQVTNSIAFRNGCLVYIKDPSRGADADDEGHSIE